MFVNPVDLMYHESQSDSKMQKPSLGINAGCMGHLR